MKTEQLGARYVTIFCNTA